jgi:putative ABC transport system substrate-binding protein
MRRRDFVKAAGSAVVAGAVCRPLDAHAQPPGLTAVGFLYSASAGPHAERSEAFRRGLAETGFTDGQNVAIEYRFAEGRYEALPALARELVNRPVAAIAASGITATRAAKAATATIPIVFNTGGDPVRLGLVTNLAKPEGNLTGVATLGKDLVAKQLELLHEFIPAAKSLAFLVNPNNAVAQQEAADAQAAAGALRRMLERFDAGREGDFESAFAGMAQQRIGGILVQADPFFSSMRDRILALSARHAVPTISPYLDYAGAGGLLSYGSSIPDALRLVGNYVGRILKGERPADLPVQQAVKVRLIVNLKTAKALGLNLPNAILLRADEVIE